MSFFEKLFHNSFSQEEIGSLAALCASAALLAGVAIFLNGADPKAIINSPSSTAASVLSLFDSGANAAAVATYTTSGSWTAPGGVTSVTVTIVGGGGGGSSGAWSGGGCNGDAGLGGAGGAGGYILNQVVAVTPGQAYSVVVGSGGAGGPRTCGYTSNNAYPGGTSSFGSVTATGGGAGVWYAGGAGGTPQVSTCTGGDPNKRAGTSFYSCPYNGTGGNWYCSYGTTPGTNSSGYGSGGRSNCGGWGGSGTAGYVSVSFTAGPPPQLSISANPQTVSYNSGSTLSWSATGGGGYDACYLSGGQYGSNPGTPVGTSGALGTGALTANTQYSYTCHDTSYGWVTPVHADVTVMPQSCTTPANACGMTATGQIINGTCNVVTPSNTLCPCTSAANACGMTNSGHLTANGLSCDAAPPANNLCPAFTAVPAATLPGQAVTLAWSCPAPPYTESQGDSHYSTGGALSGNATVNPTQTTTYNLYCKFGNNQTSRSATVTVAQPNLSITAVPTRVQKGRTATVSWSATNVTAGSCHVSGTDGASWTGASGSQTPVINASVIYTLACSVPSGPVSKSVTVGIVPVFQEI